MTPDQLRAILTDENRPYEPNPFDHVQNKRSTRADLHAFLLLAELVPGDCDMVSAAEHDQIYLDVDFDTLAAVITEDQAMELIRCGVWLDEDHDSLSMFV